MSRLSLRQQAGQLVLVCEPLGKGLFKHSNRHLIWNNGVRLVGRAVGSCLCRCGGGSACPGMASLAVKGVHLQPLQNMLHMLKEQGKV